MAFNIRRGITEKRQQENAIDAAPVIQNGEFNLNFKHVCITGTIRGYTRDQAYAALRKMFPNMWVDNSVTRDTDILITGYGVGQRKMSSALSLGVQIIESNKFFK